MRKLLSLALLLVLAISLPGQVKKGGGYKEGGTIKTAVQAAGGPVDFVNDTFTDTSGTVLSSHTGELGATWTQHPSYTTATIEIGTNGTSADKDSLSGTGAYYASGIGASANYTVECAQHDRSSANLSSACAGWVDTTANSMVGIRRQNATTVEFFKIIAGTFTSLQTATITYTQDLSRTYKVVRNGNDFTAFNDGVALGAAVTITDTEVSGIGRIGMRMTGSWSVGPIAYPVDYIKAYQAGPTDFVNDTFTDTDNTVLSSHTGEVGATWTQHPACTTGTIIILSNRAHKDTAVGNGCYFASGTPANANYTVEVLEVDLTAVGLASRACGWTSTSGTFSGVCVGRSNTTTVELIKFIAGAGTQLDTATVTYTQDQIRELKVTRSGNDFEWFLDDVSQGTFTITDTEVSGAGSVGIRMNNTWSANTVFPMNSIRAYQ